ncbi:MAG: PIN domain-containing protein [Armatimonadota bacterium]|nr:PIN domain-containing protein [Armatimonadota bacterium]
MRILLDTNIVLRNATEDDPQHRLVAQTLDHLLEQDYELCIGIQNVLEFWVVATRPRDVNGLGLLPAEARQEVTLILDTYDLLSDPPDLLVRWLDLCTRYAVSGRAAHDARLVAPMLAHASPSC